MSRTTLSDGGEGDVLMVSLERGQKEEQTHTSNMQMCYIENAELNLSRFMWPVSRQVTEFTNTKQQKTQPNRRKKGSYVFI